MIDFGFDYNWGYLRVTRLITEPAEWESEVVDRQLPRGSGAASGARARATVKVRVKEMSEGHHGLDLPCALLKRLAEKCPGLRKVKEEHWAKEDGPLATIPMDVVRLLLHWATTGKLRYTRRRTKAVHDALKACGDKATARKVKLLEARDVAQGISVPSSSSSS